MNSSNANRLRAKELVVLFPGIHLRELQRLLRASFNTTRYHAHNLETDGEVVCKTVGGFSRLFPVGFDESTRELYSVLHNRTTRRLLVVLSDGGRHGNGDLSAATGLPKSTVSEHIELLCQSHLVGRTATLGGGSVYEIQDAANVADVLAIFERNLMTVAADSFIELWDF